MSPIPACSVEPERSISLRNLISAVLRRIWSARNSSVINTAMDATNSPSEPRSAIDIDFPVRLFCANPSLLDAKIMGTKPASECSPLVHIAFKVSSYPAFARSAFRVNRSPGQTAGRCSITRTNVPSISQILKAIAWRSISKNRTGPRSSRTVAQTEDRSFSFDELAPGWE